VSSKYIFVLLTAGLIGCSSTYSDATFKKWQEKCNEFNGLKIIETADNVEGFALRYFWRSADLNNANQIHGEFNPMTINPANPQIKALVDAGRSYRAFEYNKDATNNFEWRNYRDTFVSHSRYEVDLTEYQYESADGKSGFNTREITVTDTLTSKTMAAWRWHMILWTDFHSEPSDIILPYYLGSHAKSEARTCPASPAPFDITEILKPAK